MERNSFLKSYITQNLQRVAERSKSHPIIPTQHSYIVHLEPPIVLSALSLSRIKSETEIVHCKVHGLQKIEIAMCSNLVE
jgi:hypothetical protein